LNNGAATRRSMRRRTPLSAHRAVALKGQLR
jgi:hypothetical protein